MILIVIALICLIMLLAMLIFCITDIISGKGGPDGNFVTVYSFIFSFIIFILLIFQVNKPTAMDVYRGQTTLEITYKDKVPVDSTVVWKNNK